MSKMYHISALLDINCNLHKKLLIHIKDFYDGKFWFIQLRERTISKLPNNLQDSQLSMLTEECHIKEWTYLLECHKNEILL